MIIVSDIAPFLQFLFQLMVDVALRQFEIGISQCFVCFISVIATFLCLVSFHCCGCNAGVRHQLLHCSVFLCFSNDNSVCVLFQFMVEVAI